MQKTYTSQDLVDRYDKRHFGGAAGRLVFSKDCSVLQSLLQDSHGLVLDVPCGTGIYSQVMSLNGNRVVAADGSLSMLERTGQRDCDVIQVMCDANHLPFRESTFDAAITIRLFQHLPKNEVRRILKELRRVVKPAAPVVFDTFRWSPKQIPLFAKLLGGEFRVLSWRDVESLVASAQMRIVKKSSVYLFSPIWYRRLPVAVVSRLDAVERLLPQKWLLRTFWASSRAEAISDQETNASSKVGT